MGNSKYKTIQLPTDLVELIDEIVAKHKFAYRSRAEFVVEAIRRKIEEIPKKEVAATV